MDEFYELMNYLPISHENGKDFEYTAYLWNSFEQNYDNEKYQFALLAHHMLCMCFVYSSIWKIKYIKSCDFKTSLIGFSEDDEDNFLYAKNPFTFSRINERRSFRFLKLIGCDNEEIKEFKKLVDRRNEIAHANGTIYYNDRAGADQKISNTLEHVRSIHQRMEGVIHSCLHDFLATSWNEEEREYTDTDDQIREILIRKNYLSSNDLQFCLDYNLNELSDHENFPQIKNLHETFAHIYAGRPMGRSS